MPLIAKLLDGRRGSMTGLGFSSLTRRYQIIRDNPPTSATAIVDEGAIFSAIGLPTIGEAHPLNPSLACAALSFEEGTGAEKNRVIVEATYSAESTSMPGESVPRNQSVEKLQWTYGSETRDAVCDVVTGAVITSSAGEPFDSTPQISVPLRTWTKIFRTKRRHLEWQEYAQKINNGTVTCGGVECAPKTLKCEGVSEERIWSDPDGWRYRYTITMTLMSNLTKVADGNVPVEIGWDLAIVDSGMYQLGNDGKLELITIRDAETRVDRPVTAPVLLNGSGLSMGDYRAATDPFILRFQVYKSVDFPASLIDENGERDDEDEEGAGGGA